MSQRVEAGSPSSEPKSTLSCLNCKKTAAELSQSLKQRARCHSDAYCSRECQKAHCKEHKKTCSSKAGDRAASQSLSNPNREEIVKHARLTVLLINALHEHSKANLEDMGKTEPTMKNTYGFARSTFENHWTSLLSPLAYAKLRCEDPEDLQRAIEANPSLSSSGEEWPPFNMETFNDALGRGFLVSKIILNDRDCQKHYGGTFNFGEKVEAIAREMVEM